MGKKRQHTAVASADTTAAVASKSSHSKQDSAGTQPKAIKKARAPSHQHTDAAPTGLGQQLSAAPGRLARGPLPSLSSSRPVAKWAPPAAAPSSCPHNPEAAVDLELARAAASDQLRHKFASLAAKAGLRNVPLLAFERWRFAAKWAEDEPQLAAAGAGAGAGAQTPNGKPAQQQQQDQKAGKKHKQKQQSTDPVIPFGTLTVAPEPGLVTDLIRAGLDAAAAVDVATQLASVAAAAAAVLVKKRQQLASGKPAGCGAVQVEFHKYSLDFTCSGTFVKISRPAYGKLARLYRQHWTDRVGSTGSTAVPGCSVGLSLEEAAAHLAALQDSFPTAAVAGPQPKRRKAADPTAESASDTDSETEADDGDQQQQQGGIGGVSGSSTGKQQLDAEACIAELEQQQQQQEALAAGIGDSTGSSSTRADFHARLFALLLRYKSIQGHGFQAAAGPSVFDLLRSKAAVGYECFASPLNAHFSRFGSAFPDVDAPFGSGGSFFRMNLKHGSYEVNPPFVPSILIAAAQHMLQLLQAAEDSGGALAFVVLMPGWQEVAGWQALNSSSFKQQSLLLAAADHGYCDGASHQRKDFYRQSPFDSSIFLLQTTAAAKKWPVSEQLLKDLQVAFAACCPSAAAAERQKKRRGARDLEAKGYGVPVQKGPDAAGIAPRGSGKGGSRST